MLIIRLLIQLLECKVIAFIVILFGMWIYPLTVFTQDGDVLLGDDVYHIIDRIDIQQQSKKPIFTFTKPFGREYASEIFQNLESDTNFTIPLKIKSWYKLNRLLIDDYNLHSDSINLKKSKSSLENKIRKFVYSNHRDLFGYQSPTFRVYLNPVLYLSPSYDLNDDPNPAYTNKIHFRNSRGISLRGSIFNKIGFYSEIIDQQATYPQFMFDKFRKDNVIWGESYYKPAGNKFDFLSAKAYITYSPIKNIRIKLGRDRAYWGNGYQSLILSDHSADYYLLNITTRIWKFEYTNHFNQMIDYIPNKPDAAGIYPKKYGVWHQLSFAARKNLILSVFESVIYAATLPSGSRGFEIQYLNPLIFYRSIEQAIGSPDNSFLGVAFKYNLLKRFQLNGQFVLDDFNFGERKNGNGWWGNKFGYQIGAKWIDVAGIKALDLAMEYNSVRPYMYAHINPSSNYSHYGQTLAHPAGANFTELNGQIRYQIHTRLALKAGIAILNQGIDPALSSQGISNLNYGADIFRTDLTHNNGQSRPNYNNFTGQGIKYLQNTFNLRVIYQPLLTPLYFDLEMYYRTQKIENSASISYKGVFLNIRYFIPYKAWRF